MDGRGEPHRWVADEVEVSQGEDSSSSRAVAVDCALFCCCVHLTTSVMFIREEILEERSASRIVSALLQCLGYTDTPDVAMYLETGLLILPCFASGCRRALEKAI